VRIEETVFGPDKKHEASDVDDMRRNRFIRTNRKAEAIFITELRSVVLTHQWIPFY
jgi:hypothetical protein